MKQLQYAKDEKVLCKHGPCIYPAKILEVNEEDETYKVHYLNWNQKWDDWVEEDRLTKYTDEGAKQAIIDNRKVVENMKKKKPGATPSAATKTKSGQHSESGNVSDGTTSSDVPKDTSRASTPSLENVSVSSSRKGASKMGRPSLSREQSSPSPAPSTEPRRKRNRVDVKVVSNQSGVISSTTTSVGPDPNVESEEDFQNKREIRIKIPDDLRPMLVDDWDLITKQMKLVRLPAERTVVQLLDDYYNEKCAAKNISPQKLSQIYEATQGIKSYFDVMLGAQLLYKFERPQYATLLQNNPGKKVSEFYGFIHLLRLFVKLGGMLAYTPLDEKSLALILSHLGDFLKYMKKVKPKEKELANEYETASPEYQRLAYC